MTSLTTGRMAHRITGLVALALAGSAIACGRGGEGDDEGGGAGQAVVSVRTAVATVQPFTETLGAIGTVNGRPGHVATLSAPAQARVARVAATVGERVAPGTVLVELDQTTFAGAASAAAAALGAAERSYERTRRLVSEGIAPRKDLDQAESDLAQARANAAAARRQQSLSVLRSPISGVVTRVAATLGATADPTQALVEIADPAALDIVFNVSPSDAARVLRGAKVTMSAGSSAAGEALGIATVIDVGAAVDTATRSVTVRAQAPTTRRPLRVGETVFGRIALRTRADAIVVPVEALVPEGEELKVFVVDAGGVAHERPVTVGARTDSLAEITSGLRAGERVVTYGAYGVEDSARVAPIGAPAAAKR